MTTSDDEIKNDKAPPILACNASRGPVSSHGRLESSFIRSSRGRNQETKRKRERAGGGREEATIGKKEKKNEIKRLAVFLSLFLPCCCKQRARERESNSKAPNSTPVSFASKRARSVPRVPPWCTESARDKSPNVPRGHGGGQSSGHCGGGG